MRPMLIRLSAMTLDHLGRSTPKLATPRKFSQPMAGALIGAEVMGGEFNILT